MEELMKWQIPAFGSWEYYDEMPITQYFDSVSNGSFIGSCLFEEEDLFKVPVAMPVKYAFPYCDQCRLKVVKVSSGVLDGEEKRSRNVSQQRKHGVGGKGSAAAATPRRRAAHPMAVDEDLYKIPPELLYPKKKRKRVLKKMFLGCISLSCTR